MAAEIGRAPGLFNPLDGRFAARARLLFAAVHAKHPSEVCKPPLRIAKIGRRIEATF
jgi:hypothetical protein